MNPVGETIGSAKQRGALPLEELKDLLGIDGSSSVPVAEYFSLREEIREMFAQNVALATFFLTATGAALAATVETQNLLIALLPLGLLYLGDRVIYNNQCAISMGDGHDIEIPLRLFERWRSR